MTDQESIEYIENHGYISDIVKDIAVKAIETMIELKKRNITLSDLENYMKFEDECVKKNFTFKSLLAAREKQIAKKPIIEKGYYRTLFICPACERKQAIRFEQYHCIECGQAIDWRDVE